VDQRQHREEEFVAQFIGLNDFNLRAVFAGIKIGPDSSDGFRKGSEA
jgi:hypothetical protein